MPSAQEQIDTLQAIKEYNAKLKPSRKKKDSLPEIPRAVNVSVRERLDKDHKKKTFPADRHYHQIGILEGIADSPSGDQYSIGARQRAIQRAQSLQKIDTVRTTYANLLGITPKKPPSDLSLLPPKDKPIATFIDGFTRKREPEVCDNPFTPDKVSSQISLSVYNRPSSMANRRPRTAYTADELVRKQPGWKPPPATAEGEELAPPEVKREPSLPEFKLSSSFNFVSKNAADSMRQQ